MSTSWRDILPVHPAANLFPMMTPDEITALGEHIKNNGLKQPIVLIKTPDGSSPMRSTPASTRPPPSRVEMIRQQECPPGAQGQLGSKPWQ